MARIKHVPQLIQTECGLCCIVMLNRYYGNNIDLNDLRDYVKPGRDGVGLSMLCDILKWQKYECKSYKGPIEALEAIKEPLIVYWEKSHFVILEREVCGSHGKEYDCGCKRRRKCDNHHLIAWVGESFAGIRIFTAGRYIV